MEDKYFITCKDIKTMFNCGKNKACDIINAIKRVSDSCHLKGKVTKPDFEKWYNSPLITLKKEVDATTTNPSSTSPNLNRYA